jgi:hypothetical protein
MIVLLSGAFLIVAGLMLLGFQLSIRDQNPGSASFDAGLWNLKLVTNHIGFAVLGLGVILEIVAYIGAAIWGRGPNSHH